MKRPFIYAAVSAMLLTSANSYSGEGDRKPGYGKAGINIDNIDKSVRPADDFYRYANGNWLKNNPVPASESRYGSFNEVRDANYLLLKRILEAAADQTGGQSESDQFSGTDRGMQMIGDFYSSGMDTVNIERQGNSLLRDQLMEIGQAEDLKSVLKNAAIMQQNYIGAMFHIYAGPDRKNSEMIVPYLSQGGLSLPDREYYLKDDEKSKKIRNEYVAHIKKMFVLAGEDKGVAEEAANVILDIETRMAKISLSRVELRNPEKTYNKMTMDHLNAISEPIEWNSYFIIQGINPDNQVIVNNPAFFTELGKMLNEYPVNAWQSFLKWKTIKSAAPYLGKSFQQESFSFNEGLLKGTKEMQPRWKLVQETIDNYIGEVLGKYYCDQVFTAETKERMLEMVTNITLAFKESIGQLDWMSEETKKQALLKLEAFEKKIGYPEKWKDYSALEINRESYYGNVLRSRAFEYQRNMAKIGKPVDRMEWRITPPTVNAYYNSSMNEIVFPAGILQPPFFIPEADDAVNYGAIGAVIGHELTHGFDDQGKKFDGKGNMNNWWTSSDSAKFAQKSKVLVDQYSNYKVNGNLHINGELTLGENIADLGGLTIAYKAFKKSMDKNPLGDVDGFTPSQRFFLGFAQVWRSNIRPEAAAQRILTDPHSPTEYRCNGVLSNMPEFYEAFNVKPGDKMYRDTASRAKIW